MFKKHEINNSDNSINENCQSNTENKRKKDILVLIYRFFVVICLIAIILLIIFKPCNCDCNCKNSSDNTTYFDTTVDDSITDSNSGSADIVKDLNKQVQDGMITISMNTEPVFENGLSKGNLIIENDTSNKHPQVVQIYRNDTNELIYNSSMIPIGSFINEDTLDVNLSKGDYKCTAYFNAVDEDTGEKLGTAGADITIHIQN